MTRDKDIMSMRSLTTAVIMGAIGVASTTTIGVITRHSERHCAKYDGSTARSGTSIAIPCRHSATAARAAKRPARGRTFVLATGTERAHGRTSWRRS